mmetsp:Transcript_33778/g.79096  ORF Transcript_33778/g.79096 Transcript_33778/m.79096 type:complete len:80 (+) Transcript_33778:175-414(+)
MQDRFFLVRATPALQARGVSVALHHTFTENVHPVFNLRELYVHLELLGAVLPARHRAWDLTQDLSGSYQREQQRLAYPL